MLFWIVSSSNEFRNEYEMKLNSNKWCIRHVSECFVYVELPFLLVQQTSRWWPIHIYWWIGIDFDKDRVQYKTIAYIDSSMIVKQLDEVGELEDCSQKIVRWSFSKEHKVWMKWINKRWMKWHVIRPNLRLIVWVAPSTSTLLLVVVFVIWWAL